MNSSNSSFSWSQRTVQASPMVLGIIFESLPSCSESGSGLPLAVTMLGIQSGGWKKRDPGNRARRSSLKVLKFLLFILSWLTLQAKPWGEGVF